MLSELPAHLLDALFAYRSCEFSSLAKDGTPITTPVSPVVLPERNLLIVTTSIGLPNKAFNVRRDGRVAMLFSDPTGSGMKHAPTILIQGDAVCPDEVVTSGPELDQLWSMLAVRQPSSNAYVTNPLGRWLMDWYYMRLVISVTPRRIRYWESGDVSKTAIYDVEESYVV